MFARNLTRSFRRFLFPRRRDLLIFAVNIRMVIETLVQKSSVKIDDRNDVIQKLERIIKDGPDQLQFVSDFDHTISKFCDENGELCWTTHAVFDNETARVNPGLGHQLNALREKYVKIEFDPELSEAEKTPHMEKWWSKAHNLIAESGFCLSAMELFVRDSKIVLRDKSKQLLRMLEDASVPLILFSAGIGDLIKVFLRQQLGQLPSNVHLISNMMEMDEQNTIIGFKDPLIHTFNKNTSVIQDQREFYSKLNSRTNVILLGDSLGDLNMDIGVENEGVVLKIGFLNFNVEKLLPQYLSGYDIVLVQDQTMDVPLTIISAVCRNK